MLNLVSKRYWFFAFSLLIIIPGLIALGAWGLRPSIDFAGGTLWELRFTEKQEAEQGFDKQINEIFTRHSHPEAVTQLVQRDPGGAAQEGVTAIVRSKFVDPNAPERDAILQDLNERYGSVQLQRFQSVGPTVSAESTRAAIIAVLGASVAILAYLTLAFRKAPHPIRYGICALIAMLHDVLLVVGIAAILGRLIGLEVDALFLTALLTVISFSVHDTIVVFDRVRENVRRMPGTPFEEVVNHSLVQTLVRSINTQMTTLFTLLAVLLFGGETIRHFILILTIGLISGTYSSIFNAAQLLVVWENGELGRFLGREKRRAATA
ncbi:MAG: protein-export membrane protein SecF [Herpetosiphonaceae bacterium]|nr:MAG: protein-export membrane protein SecF [Herpetosiphonaceae bacterium]